MEYVQQQDVVYGYKDGMALVMDVFTPKGQLNGAAVIKVIGGRLHSNPMRLHKAGDLKDVQALLEAGYMVFVAAHSSRPKYTAEEILPDMPRAVRYVRYNAERFGIDPQQIGMIGKSSSGYLSLLVATGAASSSFEDDPVEGVSPEIQAVVAYFPSTDLLNYGQEGTTILQHFRALDIQAAETMFDFHSWDEATNRFERITDEDARSDCYRRCSPIYHVSGHTSPTLIFHGDKDKPAPVEQSERFISRLQQADVPHKLIVYPGEGHGWEPYENELEEVTNWFNRFLLGAE